MLPLTAAPAEAAARAHGCNFRSCGHIVNGFDAGGRAAHGCAPLWKTTSVPKAVHDYKAAIHAFEPQGITLRGVRHDPMLYSYLLDPTYSSHRLAEVALRRFNLKLSGALAESADVTGRFAAALRPEVEQAGLLKLYEEIDLPLVPVLAGMEQAGVKIDREVLGEMSSRLEREVEAKAREIWQLSGI